MPNILDRFGLQLQTRDEWLAYWAAKYQDIYGADINLGSDTPDGQMMNIIIQVLLDQQDANAQIYNSFDPDNAVGVVLDQRVAINGIQRQAGTYTVTPVTVVTSQSVNLFGLDQSDEQVFTVSDNAGNHWLLQETQLGIGPGTDVLNFRAATPGAQLTVPNTINVPVTIVLGVTSINNPTTYTTLGLNEESDAVLKVRRQKSVSLASQGYLAGLLAALENITGMASAFVYENNSDVTDGDGIPSHTIWVIVSGTAADADIAQAIYTKRNAGAGLFGSTSYVITQVNGLPFTVLWDVVIPQALFMTFTVSSLDGVTAPNIAAIRAGLGSGFVPGVNAEVNINALATMVQQIDPNTLVTAAGFSTAVSQIMALSGIAASGSFKLNYNGVQSAAINWNDSIGTIQTKLQGMTGLSAATVTGSIASQLLTFNLSAITDILGLLYVSNNTLATVAPVAITFGYSQTYTNTLSPSSKQRQFVVSADDIIITPMQLSPAASQITTGGSVTFTGLGGYGTYFYSILTNNSGASIDSSSGLYTAGATPNVMDTVKVVDSLGNIATTTISVF